MAQPSDFRAALADVPASMLMRPDAILAVYVDLAESRALPSIQHPEAGRLHQRLLPAIASDALQALLRNDAAKTWGNWEERTGLPIAEPSSFLVFGPQSDVVTVWRFQEEGRRRAFLAGLEGRGFTNDGEGRLTNGEPGRIDVARRDPANPFAGPLGRASMLAPAVGGVAQSHDPKTIAALRSPAGPGFANLPNPKVALEGLGKVAGKARLPQAVVLGIGASASDPLSGLPPQGPPKKPRAPEGETALAPAVIVADIEEPGRRGAIVSMGFPDCDKAAQATASFAASWRTVADITGKTPGEQTNAEPVTSKVEGGGGCAAVISLTIPSDESAANPVYRYILQAAARRAFRALSGP